MELSVLPDAEALAEHVAQLWLNRLAGTPELRMALPAGRTPRRTYEWLAEHARSKNAFSQMHAFALDELCPPAPPEGYFWRQIRREFLAWADIPDEQCHPFRLAAPDLKAVCCDHEAAIARVGGLDLVMLGLGPNGHLAANEPGSAFDSRTRPVVLTPETVAYVKTDPQMSGVVSDRALTLGLGTILDVREIVLLVSGETKRASLRGLLEGPITEAFPASALRLHPNVKILADRAAAP